MQTLNNRGFIILSMLLLVFIGCAEQKGKQESKQGTYTELVRLLGADINITIGNENTTIDYCPDNTCESFSMSSTNPTEKLSDFVFLYLYAVSDYRALDDFRKKVAQEQIIEIIRRDSQDIKNNKLQNANDVIESLAERYSITAKFVRYDESKRNEVVIDIKSRLKRLK